MLEHLVRYAERKGLGDDPCFAAKSIKWAIVLNDDGSFQGIKPLGNPDDKNWKGKNFQTAPYTPENELLSGGKSHFLSETAETVLLWFPETPKKNKTLEETVASIKAKHDYFQELCEEACKTGANKLMPITHFLANARVMEAAKQEFISTKKAKPNDLVTFDINGANVLDMHDWQSFWRNKRDTPKTRQRSREHLMPCLATGEMVKPLAAHGVIKGVFGADKKGAKLVASYQDAFWSYGLKKSENAPVSARAESRYRAALNDLVKNSFPLVYPNKKGKGGVQLIYWTQEHIKANPIALIRNGEDATFDFFDGDPELQKGGLLAALRALHKGHYKPQGYESNQFYGCALNGNGRGPLVVRDWWETSLTDVLGKVARWFDDVSIISEGGGLLKPPKFFTFLSVLVRKDKRGKALIEELPLHIPVQLLRAALRDFPLPRAVLDRAVKRHIVEVRAREVRAERMGLIKAFLNRSGGEKMTESLNRESISIAYHCGRLLAVFEQIQSKALPNVKAGVVQRFYGAASATPGLVMGRLFRTAQHHLGSIENPTYYQKLLGEVTDKIGENFPAVLSLEEQGRFALGYYHQRSERFAGNK